MPKWTDYTIKTEPADKDEVMILDASGKANKRLGLSALSDWIIGKIANKVFENLQTQNKTILGAINELNSNISRTQNISDFDSKHTTIGGRLRILYGIIENVAYISFDVIWIRIQFKADQSDFSWRIVYGDNGAGKWTQIK